mmetsp:Transcript_69238/g.219077  ORF Transcript_69238/g.219077 Transcript_69238/m.219077 type:complete len:283 (+) Transcript_69238:270-1118(+)
MANAMIRKNALEALRHDVYLVDQRAKWDRQGAADSPPPGIIELDATCMVDKRPPRDESPYPRPMLPAPPKRPPKATHNVQGITIAAGGGRWAQDNAPLMCNTLGYHTAVLGHDGLFPHQGPQWRRGTPPRVETPPFPSCGFLRPATAMGYELRARRKIGDWGLGEAGRSRHEANILFERHFPMWGRVGGKNTKMIGKPDPVRPSAGWQTARPSRPLSSSSGEEFAHGVEGASDRMNKPNRGEARFSPRARAASARPAAGGPAARVKITREHMQSELNRYAPA